MAKWIEKQYQTTPLGAVVENSMTSGSVVNAPSVSAVQNAFSNPNLLINGDFQVWQRGENLTFEVTNKIEYSADRWCLYADWESRVMNVKKNEDGSLYSTVPLYQILETKLKDGENYTLSAKVNGIIHELHIVGGIGCETEFLRYQTNSLQSGYNAINIRTPSYPITVEWVKLEQGEIATPFASRPYAEEKLMCQRFFIYLENTLASRTKSLSTIACEIRGQFPVPMRIAPTLELGVGMYRDTGAGQNAATIENVYTNYQAYGLRVYFGNVLDGTSNAAWVWGYVDAEIY